MSALEDDLLRYLKAYKKAQTSLEVQATRQLAALYEAARSETLEYLLNTWGHLETYELQHIERTLQGIERVLDPYTRESARLRLKFIDEGVALGERFAWNILSADATIAAPIAHLGVRFGLIDRPMVNHLFSDIPKLAGKVTDDVLGRIRNELVKGAVRGESIPKLARRVAGTGLTQEGLKRPFGTLRKRGTTIARTEIIKAGDAGYESLVTQAAAVIQVEVFDLYLTAGDGRVDPPCPAYAQGLFPGGSPVPGYPGVYKRGGCPRPVIDTHPRCRCRRVPILLRWLKEGLVKLPNLQAAA